MGFDDLGCFDLLKFGQFQIVEGLFQNEPSTGPATAFGWRTIGWATAILASTALRSSLAILSGRRTIGRPASVGGPPLIRRWSIRPGRADLAQLFLLCRSEDLRQFRFHLFFQIR